MRGTLSMVSFAENGILPAHDDVDTMAIGEVRTLFAQEHHSSFSAYLDKFFATHQHPSVSWIHDVGKGRFGIAADALLEEADSAGELSAKHVRYNARTTDDATSFFP